MGQRRGIRVRSTTRWSPRRWSRPLADATGRSRRSGESTSTSLAVKSSVFLVPTEQGSPPRCALTTLTTITSGRASVAGVDVAADPDGARRKIGVALQEAGLDPRQTGRELLTLQARLFGTSASEASDRAAHLLTLVDLVDPADRRIKGYSGGMNRRLDLASALVHEPEVLFLDEPTTGLDPASRLTVWEELRRINHLGTTIFLTTQYLEEADQLCDRIAIIDNGVIVREGTPAQLKSELQGRRPLSTTPTLDEVFLDATGRSRERLAGEVQEVRA